MDLILLGIGFVSLLALLFTKYARLSGIVSFSAFSVYFFLISSGNWLYFFILLFGLILLVLEAIIPSFGVIGVVGSLMTIIGIYLSNDTPLHILMKLTMASVLSIVCAVVLIKSGVKLKIGKNLVLSQRLDKANNYQTNSVPYEKFLYQKGITTTSLRPVGRAEILGEDIEVLSQSQMISENSEVFVYKVEGNRVYVKKV